MTKSKFIGKIRLGLRFSIPRRELKEIIKHYENYIDSSENQALAIEECGDPNLIVEEILHERGLPSNMSKRLIALVALGFFSYAYFDMFDAMFSMHEYSLIPLLALYFPVLSIIIGNKALFKKHDRNTTADKILFIIILVVLSLQLLIAVSVILSLPEFIEIFAENRQYIGKYFSRFLFINLRLSCYLAAFGGYRYFKIGKRSLIYVVISLIFLSLQYQIINIITSADLSANIDSFTAIVMGELAEALLRTVLVLAISFAATWLVQSFIYKISLKSREVA